MKKLSIIIPVYNEKKTIEKILSRIVDLNLGDIAKEVVIVDDGSVDGTREILRKYEKVFKVFYLEKNSGKCSAIKFGLPFVTGDFTVIQDADLEYDPEDFKKLINRLGEGDKAIYGSRNLQVNPRSKLSYYYGGKLVTAFVNILFNSHLTDVNTCYKMIYSNLLKSLNIQQKKFSFCEEVTVKLLKRKIKIIEVPVGYSPRRFTDGKKIRFYDGLTAILTILKYKFFVK